MKRLLTLFALSFLLASGIAAQQNPADAPASKEDIQRYLDVMHSREMMAQMVEAMSKPMRQMTHETYLKHKDEVPPDFENRMNALLGDYMKSFPWEEVMQAMVPVYQKHLTKGDVQALVVFYSSPTGQKLIKEIPEMTAEAMQTVLPLLQKQIEGMTERMRTEAAQMIENSKSKPSAPVRN